MSGHYIKECICGNMLEQCRCPSWDNPKPVRIEKPCKCAIPYGYTQPPQKLKLRRPRRCFPEKITHAVEYQDDGQWSVAHIICDDDLVKGIEFIGAFPTRALALTFAANAAGGSLARVSVRGPDKSCERCNHAEHVPGACDVLYIYDRPNSPPGNQRCLCGYDMGFFTPGDENIADD